MTNDINFILDKPKSNITVLPVDLSRDLNSLHVIGEFLAEKVLNKNCSFDISCWKFDRFLTTK